MLTNSQGAGPREKKRYGEAEVGLCKNLTVQITRSCCSTFIQETQSPLEMTLNQADEARNSQSCSYCHMSHDRTGRVAEFAGSIEL